MTLTGVKTKMSEKHLKRRYTMLMTYLETFHRQVLEQYQKEMLKGEPIEIPE